MKLKISHFILIGFLAILALMAIVTQIPGKPAEPLTIPASWFDLIKPEDLVDFGVVPQEKQTLELAAGKVAQFLLEPGQSVSIVPKKETLIIGFISLTAGDAELAETFNPQKAEEFTLHAGNGQRLIFVMSQLFTATEFEVGPANLLIAP